MKFTPRLVLLATFLIPASIFAIWISGSTKFSLKDPKSVNVIRFTLDGRVESLSGMATDISGDVTFDPTNVEATRGKAIVQTKSLSTSHPNMTDHMLSARWMDAAQFPTIEFEIKKVEDVKKLDEKDECWTMSVVGDFSMHGVTRSMMIPVKITSLPGQLIKRNRGKGDLMVFRSSFVIKRSDFGIDGELPLDLVSDEVSIDLSIAAFAPAPAAG